MKSPAVPHALWWPAFAAVVLLATAGCRTRNFTWADWVASSDPAAARRVVHDGPLEPTTTGPVAYAKPYGAGDGARPGPGFDLAMRNPDFPRTRIAVIHIDLTGPGRHVHLQWTGPLAAQGPVGPWRSCSGRGRPGIDCNDVETSNTVDTLCTPKGVFPVAGFSDHLNSVTTCHYATWVVHAPRYIAVHSHTEIPDEPGSAGCIRVPYDTAKLIHNNAVAGTTLIRIFGTWKPASR